MPQEDKLKREMKTVEKLKTSLHGNVVRSMSSLKNKCMEVRKEITTSCKNPSFDLQQTLRDILSIAEKAINYMPSKVEIIMESVKAIKDLDTMTDKERYLQALGEIQASADVIMKMAKEKDNNA